MTQHTYHDYDRHGNALRESVTGIVAYDAIDHDDRLDGPCLELTVGPEDGTGKYARVPPRVHRALADRDLGSWDTTRRVNGYFTVVVR